MPDLKKLTKEITNYANQSQAAILQRFFKTALGQYGAGDIFLGLKVPLQRQIARKYSDLDLVAIAKLLANKIHEFRLIGLLILVEQYAFAPDLRHKKIIVDFYLQNTSRINNWDLVDLSAPKILGDFLWEQKKLSSRNFRLTSKTESILSKLAISSSLWERRIAIVATYAFIKNGQADEALGIAQKLLGDREDLIHKAVGWMLREVGKRVSERKLLIFLNYNHLSVSRTTLRYAIERLSPSLRASYLAK
ncbi:MAG: DNA alkylation repair protein [Patescibacteria group bacterium]|jgi:3-methyladenine DNA glycosylase AlkD